MTRTIRHPNGVTLPGAWFDGAEVVLTTANPAQVPAISAKAEKQRRILCALTDHWQDIRTLANNENLSETVVRTAANTLHERGLVATKFERNGMGKRKLYRLTAQGKTAKDAI